MEHLASLVGVQREPSDSPLSQRSIARDRQTYPNEVSQDPKLLMRLRLYAALIGLDALSVLLAFSVATLIRLGSLEPSRGFELLPVLVVLFLGVALNSRAYSLEVLRRPRVGILRAARSLAFATGVLIAVIYYLKAGNEHSRGIMTLGAAGTLVLVVAARSAFGEAVGRRLNWRFTNEILIVDEVSIMPKNGEIMIFADQARLSPTTNDPELLDRVGRLIKHCERVIVACPPSRRAAWAGMLKGAEVDVEILSPELEQIGALGVGQYDHRATVLVGRGPLAFRDRVVKRTFDLALTLPALVILAPLFCTIALSIKLDSPGPVFFKQPRVGRGNRMFKMYKFRSMCTDMLDANASTLTQIGDKRVTKVGDFLRRTSLDELPQLINVVRGDMSIAGPRPHAIGALAGASLYWEVDSRYWHRHAVKPGMTGLAQVRGFRGTTFKHSDLTNRLQADLEYVSGWSIWRDIRIVLATVRVLTHRNAF